MGQESNTTSDTNPKPKLQIARPKDAPAAPDSASPPSAPETPAGMPRFSFARKKTVEEAPPAAPPPPAPAPTAAGARPSSGSTGLPLQRPPPGSRLFPAHELAAPDGTPPAPLTPLTPVTCGVTAAPFPLKGKIKAAPRSHVPLLIILGILVVIVGGESTYILMQDQKDAAVNPAAPPVIIGGNASAGKPQAISAGGPADTPAAKFLQAMPVDFVDAGDSPKLSIGGRVFQPGQIIDQATGLKWTLIDDKARQLEFVDRQGRRYIMKF